MSEEIARHLPAMTRRFDGAASGIDLEIKPDFFI